MPSAPDKTYKHDGWQGYGHWLGTGNLAGGKLAFLPFKKALLYARTLKLKSIKEWRDWAKTGARPANMPSAPDKTYKHDGWQGYGHWLGTGNLAGSKLAVPAVQEGAAVCTHTQAERHKEWKTGPRLVSGLPTCPPPRHNLQARRMARLWALAWHRQRCRQRQAVPAVQEGAAACTLTQAEKQQRLEGLVPRAVPGLPTCPPTHIEPTSTTGGKAMGTGLAPATCASNGQQFLPFKKALLYAHSLKLKAKRMEDWAKTGVRPANMPSNPEKSTSTTDGKAMGTGLAPATFVGQRPAVPAV